MAHGFKTGGRKKGTPNKITKEVRESIQDFVEGEIKEIPQLIGHLEPQERLSFLIKLLPYVVPRLKHTETYSGPTEITVTSFLEQFEKGDK